MAVAVLVPVLDRPHRVQPLVDSLAEASQVIQCDPVFLCSPGDHDEIEAVYAAGAEPLVVPFQPGRGDYARKLNHGFERTRHQFVFLAADDLTFHPGWIERAIARWYETDACVIGTNDLGNTRVTSGLHSTHTLVHRAYGECGTIDGDELLHPGYWHNFVDDEFVQTALARDTFAMAKDSIVEHLHPNWGKGRDDPIYRLGQQHFSEDRAYHQKRKLLWK